MRFAWDEAFQDLWSHAARSRGTATLYRDAAGSSASSYLSEWPCTSGADVIAIAALIDPIVRALPLRLGGYGVERRWRSCVIELEAYALDQRACDYDHNRAFWSTLAATFAHFAACEAPPPPTRLWRALLAELASAGGHRNASGATYTVTESSYEKMWTAQQAELAHARGFDEREPLPGAVGRVMKVPRTTNADALRLSAYWTKVLAQLEIKRAMGSLVSTMGLDGERARWQAVMADIDRFARPGKPDDLYPRNHELWRASLSLSTTAAVLDEAPTPFDLAFASTKSAVIDLPGRIADAAGAVAHAVGNMAHEVGAGLFSSFGTPLLVGGGVLLGLFLLLRRGDHEAA